MVTLVVDEENVRTLPFAKVVGEKKDFQKSIEGCSAISADVFFDELEHRLDEHYRK